MTVFDEDAATHMVMTYLDSMDFSTAKELDVPDQA